MKFLKKLLNADFNSEDCTEKDYIQLLESGALYRKNLLGINAKGFIIVNPLKNPGVYAGGVMGSGKSTTFKMVLTTRACSSGDVTFFVLVDVSKGMGDYKEFFPFKQNFARATAVNDIKKLIPLMDLIDKEINGRAKSFEAIGNASNYEDYEKLYHYKLARYNMYLDAIKKGRDIRSEEKSNPREIYDCLVTKAKDYRFLNIKDIVISIPDSAGNPIDPFKTFLNTHESFCNLAMNPTEFFEWIGSNNILRLTPEQNQKIVEFSEGQNVDLSDLIITKEFAGVANIVLAFEEFADIPTSEIVNWVENVHVDGSIAKILARVARIARSYGIEIMIATQGYGDAEFPHAIRKGVTNILLHKGNFPVGESIKVDPSKFKQSGHFAMEDFEGRAPYVTDIAMGQLMRKYCKPCKGEMFSVQIEDYHRALEGEGVEGMIASYPLRTLLISSSAFLTKEDVVGESLHPLVARVLGLYGVSYEPLENQTLSFRGIATKNGKKFAVFFYPQRKRHYDDINQKKIMQYMADMKIYGCEEAIVINFGKDTGQASFVPRQVKGFTAEIEDLLRIANIFDNKEINIKSGLMDDLLKTTAFYGIAENSESLESSSPRKKNIQDALSRIVVDDDE